MGERDAEEFLEFLNNDRLEKAKLICYGDSILNISLQKQVDNGLDTLINIKPKRTMDNFS